MEQPAKSKEEVENLLKRLYQDREKRAKEIYLWKLKKCLKIMLV